MCPIVGVGPRAAEISVYIVSTFLGRDASYARKLVTVLSGGAFNLFDAVLEFHPLDDFCELA